MVIHDSKEQFYNELNRKIEDHSISSEEIVNYIKSEEAENNTSEFYELCSKFADIGLNAPKQADPVTCEVKACFQFLDCNIAKEAFIEFISVHDIKNVNALLDLVEIMHQYAVARDDPRSTGGLVRPQNYAWKPGFAGKYHNFKKLPDEIWNKLRTEIEDEIGK